MRVEVDIQGKDKAEVLCALYNHSKPLGMGLLEFDPSPMTISEARQLLRSETNFDYLKGRVMKVNLSGDTFNAWLYDRDNGVGAAQRAISGI